MQTIVEPSDPQDVLAIQHMEQRIFTHPLPPITLAEIVRGEKGTHRCHVIRYRELLVGYCIVQQVSRSAYIRSIAINEDQRHCGFGRALLNCVMRQSAWSTYSTAVPEFAVDAQCFFRQCGFRCVSTMTNAFSDGTAAMIFQRHPGIKPVEDYQGVIRSKLAWLWPRTNASDNCY